MFVTRKLTTKVLIGWLGKHILWLLAFYIVIAILYHYFDFPISLPWLPVSVIGTAVAFFVGFKNNQAYDRLWEARKIWGSIINDSRTFGMRVSNFLRTEKRLSENEAASLRQKIIYRHIAWLYVHRNQLLQRAQWEQISDKGLTGKYAKKYEQNFGLNIIAGDLSIDEVEPFLVSSELEAISKYKNAATQIIHKQSEELIALKDKGYIDSFEHVQLEELLKNFYTLQGQNERIKKFPFPRDYSTMSRFFVMTFIFLFPFSLIPELMKMGCWAFWISIPVATIIGLVYLIMEDLGDYAENPFMGTPHAMPMLSMCRTIEIDLREMLKETDLPPAIQPKDSVLM